MVDWQAALRAGMVGGATFLAYLVVVVPLALGGSWAAVVRLLASPALGQGVLDSTAAPGPFVALAAIGTHFFLSAVFAIALAAITSRAPLGPAFTGALFGSAIYAMHYVTLQMFFDWFLALHSWWILAGHMLYGTVTATVYQRAAR